MRSLAVPVLILSLGLPLAAPAAAPDDAPDDAPADAAEYTIASLPPSVVRTVPECGAADVDPGLKEISVTFSKDMQVTGHCWSWCYVAKETFPRLDGETEYLPDRRTCVLHVALEPEKTYAIWINVDQYRQFKDEQQHPAVPYLLVFRTGPAGPEPGARRGT